MKSTWKGFHHFRSLQAYLSAADRSQQQLSTPPLLVKHTPCFIMLRTWNKMETEQRCSLSTRSRTAELLQAAKETVTNVPQISGVSLSRLQSKTELWQGVFPLLEMTDVPHSARAQQRALLWTSLTYSGCLLKTSCRRRNVNDFFSFFVVHRSIWTYSIVCLSIQLSYVSIKLPTVISPEWLLCTTDRSPSRLERWRKGGTQAAWMS